LALVSFKGVVKDLVRETIPRILFARIESDDGRYVVEMDMHRDLVVYPVGTRVEFVLSRELPDYRDGVDFVARATYVTSREEDGERKYLFSIGGLLVVLHTSEELPITPTEKFYVKLAKLE